ncbi:sodium:solute symporter family transporter [Mesomycoplasma ovipneumoniae]|uniref:sodium:solute symporter family transporter n=1 Tax=Mesomycoplasma ovipneumoniae TaxID=29562 RepID=UPI00311C9C44
MDENKSSFSTTDWIILAIYMLSMLLLGLFFWYQEKNNKQKSTDSYLVAKSIKVPSIVIALSIWATGLSSLTFLGLPGLAFKTGWMWSVGQVAIILISPVLIKWIIPFYRQITANTAYAYLQSRYNYLIRALSGGLFAIFHIFRIAIVLYIPALTLSLFVDLDIYLIIGIMAIVVILNTFLGGFKGVLWTDAIQGLVLLLGIICILIFGLVQTDWSKGDIYQSIFNAGQWKISAASGGMFLLFLGKYVETIFSYTASQDIVQRYKTSKFISGTNKTIYINAILTLITIFVFYGVGSMLYSYFKSQGFDVDAKNAIDQIVGRENAANNQLLSFFIIKVLPTGLSGLIIAAVFAASQSTISSSMNSLVNVIVSDFIQPIRKFRKKAPIKDRIMLIISKILITFFGIQGMLVAFLLAYSEQTNLFNLFLAVVGLFGVPIGAVFMLGILTRRTNSFGAVLGISVAFITALFLWIFTNKRLVPENLAIEFASEYVALISFFLTIIFGYVGSIIYTFFSKKEKNLTNLTIWTKTPEFDQLIALEKQIAKNDSKLQKVAKKVAKTVPNLMPKWHQILIFGHPNYRENETIQTNQEFSQIQKVQDEKLEQYEKIKEKLAKIAN